MPKHTATQLRKKCVALAKKIVYLRDKNTCTKCGVKCCGKNRHASHIISEGRSKLLSCDPLNMKVLCSDCHKWWHYHPNIAILWFGYLFPGRMEYLAREFQKSNGSVGVQYYIDKCEVLEYMYKEMQKENIE